MDAAAWIALINAIISSGLADKLVGLLIQIFNALSQEMQAKVANAAGQKFLTLTLPGAPTA